MLLRWQLRMFVLTQTGCFRENQCHCDIKLGCQYHLRAAFSQIPTSFRQKILRILRSPFYLLKIFLGLGLRCQRIGRTPTSGFNTQALPSRSMIPPPRETLGLTQLKLPPLLILVPFSAHRALVVFSRFQHFILLKI